MKFWAKVRFKGEKNAEYLIRAFFREFDPESSIVIRGKEAKVECIFHSDPPMQLIEAITCCEVSEFFFGKALEEYIGDKAQSTSAEEGVLGQITQSEGKISGVTVQATEDDASKQKEQVQMEEKTSEQSVQTEAGEEIDAPAVQVTTADGDYKQAGQTKSQSETSQSADTTKRKRGRTETKKAETTKVVNVEIVKVPQLEELAKNATSFENFVKLVAEWLEMGKKQEFFKNLVFVATEVEKISWKALEKGLDNKNVRHGQYDRIVTGAKVAEKLKDYSVTILPLLTAMVQYKEYSFEHEQSDKSQTEQATGETVSAVEEKSSDEVGGTIPESRMRMECMPEIPHFEKVLGSVDKTLPIEERVRLVLNAMGWDMLNDQEQHQIFEIANTAVRVREITFDTILMKAKIPMECFAEARMTFAKFINNFIIQNDSDKRVKVLDFLEQLQEIIIHESEIESSTDLAE